MKIIILANDIPAGAQPDELDSYEQAEFVRNLIADRYHSSIQVFSYEKLHGFLNLQDNSDACYFNLVEEIAGDISLMFLAPELLESRNQKFTGSSSRAIRITTDKVLTKQLLVLNNIATPSFLSKDFFHKSSGSDPRYLLKPMLADASQGLIEDEIKLSHLDEINVELLNKTQKLTNKLWFAEEYIAGREFNISIIEKEGQPLCFPVAEIIFENFKDEQLKIVGYKAKWESDSFWYKNTIRSFSASSSDRKMHEKLHNISTQIWKLFDLSGYARVDFRVNQDGQPLVLEINTNPCISADSGFISAANKAGYSSEAVVDLILKAALNEY